MANYYSGTMEISYTDYLRNLAENTYEFVGMERAIGVMAADMEFARLNDGIQKSTEEIRKRLDAGNDTLKNPLHTKARELYRQALTKYAKGFYQDVLDYLQSGIAEFKTDCFSWFLLGKTYLFGVNRYNNTVDVDKAIDALQNAAHYIEPNTKVYNEARLLGAEILFYLGLACQTKAGELHFTKKTEDAKKYLQQALQAFERSFTYSDGMLESLYNAARCKVLLGAGEKAVQKLEMLVLKDRRYCLKLAMDPDFTEIQTQICEMLDGVKKTVYPEMKARLTRLQTETVSAKNPQLMEIFGSLTEDMSVFDMLGKREVFHQIESLLEKELQIRQKREKTEDFARIWNVSNGVLIKYNGTGGNVIIPENIIAIGKEAFVGCENLTGVTIPSSVTFIGGGNDISQNGAFAECINLSSVTIPSSVISIGAGTFAGCNSLSSVTIPSSVTSIGAGAFARCISLSSVTIPSSVISIGAGAFANCTDLCSITIPSSVTTIGEQAFAGCTGLNSVTIPSSVTAIGERAFWECRNLSSVTIPSLVTAIGEQTFAGCTGLSSVTIPSSVTSIGAGAFWECRNLSSVTIPSSVTFIGAKAFWECTGLSSVIIPSSVTFIGKYAFAVCRNLSSVTIPESLRQNISKEDFPPNATITFSDVPKEPKKNGWLQQLFK